MAADAARRVERVPLQRWGGALAGVAVVTAAASLLGPAFIRNAVSALLLVSRDVEAAAPYRIEVTPGNATVPKGADQMVTAKLLGFESEDGNVMARRTAVRTIVELRGIKRAVGEADAAAGAQGASTRA